MTDKTTTIVLVKSKDCKGSVRFDAATKDPLVALTSIYVSRSFHAINDAQEVRVTIEVVK